MARLRQADGSTSWLLPARGVLGRSRACTLRLSAPEVSGEHAVVRWSGGVWEIQDLFSRNGTFVDGRRVETGQRAGLWRDCVLGFGKPDGYVLADDGAPQPFAALEGTARVVEAQGGLLALPDPGSPELTIHREGAGWTLERGAAVRPTSDGDSVQTSAGVWRLYLPELLPRTCEYEPCAPTVGALTLRFRVSRDEEYIELVALHGARTFDLKARAHHYPLLLLARARLADHDKPPEQQGWIHQDDLLRQLRSDSSRLHIDIYRCRRQLAEVGIADPAQIVERRAGTRQLRIGVARLEIASLVRRQGPPVSGL